MSEQICVCEEINCPYFCGENHGYGCRRYNVSGHCHLLKVAYMPDNQYALYSGDRSSLETLKRENIKFLRDDEKYNSDIQFQKDFPDLFEGKFKVKEIN